MTAGRVEIRARGRLASHYSLGAALLLALGCGSDPAAADDDVCEVDERAAEPPLGIRVVGNRLEDADGNPVQLHGVNRSGTEYRCIQGYGFSDGPNDEASVQAIASWNGTAVRVPLNEACWLGLPEAPAEYSGCAYKKAIRSYVTLLHEHDLLPILELHWAAPAGHAPDRLQPLPNVDHSIDFWRDVAATFKHDPDVVFEPYNEPFPERNTDTDVAWGCFRDGCEQNLATEPGAAPVTYQATGMQSLVDAIRSTGARQLILVGGVRYSNALTQWLTYKPQDPQENLAAAWHVYNYNQCIGPSCWDAAPADVAAQYPLVATEIGQNDCEATFINPLMDWLDEHGHGYLAWTWNAYGDCRPTGANMGGSPYSLITDYETGEPNSNYARAFYDRLQAQR